MLKQIREVFIILLCLCGILWLLQQPSTQPHTALAQQVGTYYGWQDSLATTTTAIDCTFTTRWEEVTISTDSIPIWYRSGFGSDVTTSWSSRDWLYLPEGVPLTYGTRTKLKRFEWKADVAESGVIFFEGIKTESQY